MSKREWVGTYILYFFVYKVNAKYLNWLFDGLYKNSGSCEWHNKIMGLIFFDFSNRLLA